ncbi:MAG: polymer-forming cytoskeletal protein [Hydrogenophaga sp.]|jgi:cytoskeletal protein CcmA (bactofilin family)|uniref:bactofilin family protein n=1 Tax=Hydrogenophaga sp. TaxID=1904254 RepID=UPI002A366318|nr:polymer-forming cytoskeletal protein [Hydrogenophaga sp.]MDX9968255.1 polymer-forming cytoskeletal protein [Hydrogenophaga sp.]
MEMKPQQDTLTIDPIAMQVVNRVAAGSRLDGQLAFQGGLLVQGEVAGRISIDGRLIVWKGGTIRGRIVVSGDCYLFGRLGAADGTLHDTELECRGTVYVAHSGVSTGSLLARRLQLYEGADLQGPFRTLKIDGTLPVLRHREVPPSA